MPYSIKNENPLPDLVELKTRISYDGDISISSNIEIELRIHPHEIEDTLGTFYVSFSQATLSLDVVGLEIAPNSKFGQPVVTPHRSEVIRETDATTSLDKSTGANAAAAVKRSPLYQSVAMDGSLKHSKKVTSSNSTKETEKLSAIHLPVKAVGNDDWSITSNDGTLDGVFLDYDKLCVVNPIWGGNQRTIISQLLVKQKHIRSVVEPKFGVVGAMLQTVNQARLAKILVAKSIHNETTSSPFRGTICFARSEASDED